MASQADLQTFQAWVTALAKWTESLPAGTRVRWDARWSGTIYIAQGIQAQLVLGIVQDTAQEGDDGNQNQE